MAPTVMAEVAEAGEVRDASICGSCLVLPDEKMGRGCFKTHGFDKGAGVGVADPVSGGDDGEDAFGGGGVDEVVEGGRDGAFGAERHVDDGFAGAAFAGNVVDCPLES